MPLNYIELSFKGSPMILDSSLDLGSIQDESPEQRFDRLLSVPEYAEEVYSYLRELEVKYFEI